MVDLNGRTGALAADEVDGRAGVLIRQGARQDDAVAGPGLERFAGQVAGQDVVAGIAAVAVCIGPGRSKLVPGVTGLRGAALDRNAVQLNKSLGCLTGGATACRLSSMVAGRSPDAVNGAGGNVTATEWTDQEQGGRSCQGRGDGANDVNGPSVLLGEVPR